MLLVDSADGKEILEALKLSGVQGFTTNPALMARAAGVEALALVDYILHALALCGLCSGRRDDNHIRHLMIQGVGTHGDVLRQAASYCDDLKDVRNVKLWIKLVPTNEHIACCAPLKEMGCATLVTAVFTAAQATVAMEAGADGIAVYVGRLMRLEDAWEEQLRRIKGVLQEMGRTLLLASFPNLKTVERALEFSRDLTVPPNLLGQLLMSPHSENAVRAFNDNITTGCG